MHTEPRSEFLTGDQLIAVIADTHVRYVPPSPEVIALLGRIREQLPTVHHLDGIAISEPLVLFLQLPNTLPPGFSSSQPFRIWPWGWPGNWGASLTFTVQFESPTVLCRIAVPQSAWAVLAALCAGTLTVVFLKGHSVFSVAEVSFTDSRANANLLAHVRNVTSHTQYSCFLEECVHYWEVLHHQSIFAKYLSRRDRLSLSWTKVYTEECRGTARWLADLRARHPIPSQLPDDTPAELRLVLEDVVNNTYQLGPILGALRQQFGDTEFSALGWIGGNEARQWSGPEGDDWTEFTDLRNQLYFLYRWAPFQTAYGTRVVWLDPYDATHKQLALQPPHFPRQCDPIDFWSNFPRDFAFGWGLALSPHDFPTSPATLNAASDSFPRSQDTVATLASADTLLEEAINSKRGTIPHSAVVDLPLGPFVALEFTELRGGNDVIVVCRCADGSACLVSVEPARHYCSFCLPSRQRDSHSAHDDGEGDAASREAIEAAVKLLLAAVVRDFWVVEERERVFDTMVRRRAPRARGVSLEPRVVYIPRIRYTNNPDVERCVQHLGHNERRAHFVRPHLRKAASSSDVQRLLARRYGFAVPIGYTFVRPHERGRQGRSAIYRSRSALQSLYAERVASNQRPNRWFQFERDVHQLVSSLGFDVQHVSAGRRGDGGIDVYATKGDDLETVNWVIQCKCWKPQRGVSPSVVRELIGTLISYPRGTRGMIVTTARFSTGARDLAHQHDIRLIDGDEFSERLRQIRPPGSDPHDVR